MRRVTQENVLLLLALAALVGTIFSPQLPGALWQWAAVMLTFLIAAAVAGTSRGDGGGE